MKLLKKPSCRKNNNNNITNEILLQNSSKILETFGWFQVRSLVFISFANLGCGLSLMSFVFLNIVPPFECKKQEIFANLEEFLPSVVENITTNSTFKSPSKCFRLSIGSNRTSKFRNHPAQVNITLESESCLDGLIFDTSLGNTVVSQFKLVCEDAWKRPFTIACYMIGMIFGSWFGGRLSDRFGRRLTNLWAVGILSAVSLVTGFIPNYFLYVSVLLITGSLHVLIYFTNFAWVVEIAGSSGTRAIACFCSMGAFGSGGILASGVAYFLPDWMWLFVVKGFIFCISFPLVWFAPESPFWLLQKHKLDEAAKVLKQIVTTNKISIDNSSSRNEEDGSTLCRYSFKKSTKIKTVKVNLLWKNKTLRKRCILMCILWNTFILSYCTIGLNSANLGTNAYLNNAIGCVLDVVASVLVTAILKKHDRRLTLSLTVTALGLCCFLSPITNEKNKVAGIISAMLGRFFATISMLISFLMCGELFPTMLRSTAVGFASMVSRVGVIFSPFLIFAGEEFDLSIPFYVMGGIALASIYVVLLLPETSSSLLLNTLEDALALKDPRLIPSCKICSMSDRKQVEKGSKRPVSVSTVTSTISSV